MSSPNKAELLSKAQGYGLDVNEEMLNADIQAKIDEHEAANPPAEDDSEAPKGDSASPEGTSTTVSSTHKDVSPEDGHAAPGLMNTPDMANGGTAKNSRS